MNGELGNGASRRKVVHELPDFDPCWAGEGSHAGEFCLGSTDGKLRFRTTQGEDVRLITPNVAEHEAINGVAFLKSHIAIATRADLAVLTVETMNPFKAEWAVLPIGVHGVTATADGHFVAGAGREGLITVAPRRGKHQEFVLNQPMADETYFYKAIALHSLAGEDCVVVAGRRSGIAMLAPHAGGETPVIETLAFDGADVADVCGLAAGSHGIGAMAMDQTILLFRDLFKDDMPLALRFTDMCGRPYRILSSKGHVFVLTSKALYVLPELGRRFLNGEIIGRTPVRSFGIAIEAIDANVCFEDWLLIVTDSRVVQYHVDQLIATPFVEGERAAWILQERYPVILAAPQRVVARATSIASNVEHEISPSPFTTSQAP